LSFEGCSVQKDDSDRERSPAQRTPSCLRAFLEVLSPLPSEMTSVFTLRDMLGPTV